MMCDYVKHEQCGEHVHVDEWAEHVVNPCGDCTGGACSYREPHHHGFACDAQCPCDMGMSTPREVRSTDTGAEA